MYTVLLVDDEDDVLKNLITTIDRPDYGIENILTAHDGLSACKILSSQHVDLIITDICMPNMDGIALIRRAREIQPRIRCILLSSYSNFQYAREAISLGVENYLLKPVDPTELDNSIRKSLDNLSSQKNITNTLFLENILGRWLDGDISPDELSEKAKHISINIYFRNYCVVLIKFINRRSINDFLSTFYSALRPLYDVYRFVNCDGHHISIFGGHKIQQQHIADTLSRIADEFPQTEFHAAIGYVADNYEEVHQSYQSALDCLHSDPIVSHQRISSANLVVSAKLTNFQVNSIIEYLRSDSASVEGNDLPFLFNVTFADILNCTISEINAFTASLVARVSLQLSSSGLIDAAEKDTIINKIYHFEQMPTEQELLSWFESILLLCRTLIRKRSKQLSPSVLLAMQYIGDHHKEYASIKDFCNRYNMNASYFGLLFKKETGIYFNDYINHIRISHAIQLIKDPKRKIMDIYKAVGFSYPSYFILCFKKQTGLSPTQYRQMLSRKPGK